MTHPKISSWIDSLEISCRTRLREVGQVEDVESGARLLRGRAAESHLLLIEDGAVLVNDRETGCSTFGPGELVGELAFLDNAPLCGDAVAVQPSRVRRIERLELVTAFADEPRQLRDLLDAIARLPGERRSSARRVGGDAVTFVAQLAEESVRHRAARHPYLTALADGSLPDTRWALGDFARQYFGYSAHFPRYLTAVVSRLEEPTHRKALLDNLSEESGNYDEDELAELSKWGVAREWIEGVPHPLLFERFATALGVRRGGEPEAEQVACWRESFLNLLTAGSSAEALGALGLGTENIVRTIYGPFVKAIADVGGLDPCDTVFFPLHTAVDDHHQATLQAISADFASTFEGRSGLRRGMLKALHLRTAFWDWMHERALNPERAAEVL